MKTERDYIEKTLKSIRSDIDERVHKQAFCVFVDGTFPLNPEERYNEIMQEMDDLRCNNKDNNIKE